MRRRQDQENHGEQESASWGGKLHIPGVTLFVAKSLGSNYYNLLEKEVVKGEGREKSIIISDLYKSSQPAGMSIVPQPERRSSALKIFMQVEVDPSILLTDYERITENNFDEIIDEHKRVIVYLRDKRKGPLIIDTR